MKFNSQISYLSHKYTIFTLSEKCRKPYGSPMPAPFHALTAAPFTPFHADGSLNLNVIPAYAEFLTKNRVKAAFICGTTGEGASLTTAERQQIAERWAQAVRPNLRIIVHVGHTSLGDARELARHAGEIGASAIASLAPFFFKPRDASEAVTWCAAVAGVAPSLPFYYYHIPSMTGVSFPVAEFLALAENRIPSLAGVKYTHEDQDDYTACLHFAKGKYDLLFGRDELLLESLDLGAKGAVGSTYNYAAPLYLRIMAAHAAGDLTEARRLQDQAIQMISLCHGLGVTHLAASKALMTVLGIPCGPVRLPLTQPDSNQIARLCDQLRSLGFFDFACVR